MGFSFLQIGSIVTQGLILRIALAQQTQLCQDPLGALVLELVQAFLRPLGGFGVAFSPDRLGNFSQPLSRMGKIQDPNRGWTMIIDQTL